MTREELRVYVDKQRSLNNIPYHVYSALIDGIDELEQEPCEDCISRREAIKRFTYNYKGERIPDYDCDNWPVQIDLITVREYLRDLPPVTPQTKVGHWITEIKSDLRGDMWPTNPRCSECGGEPYYSNTIYNYNFCPYCGAKMVE